MNSEQKPANPVRRTLPIVVAYEAFKAKHLSLFDGIAQGVYLEDRLRKAFEEGWCDASDRVDRALSDTIEVPASEARS